MDRLSTLRAFVQVCEQQSFAKAARRLRVSPTAASRGISELEKKLGVTLLRRTTRSVGLTSEGALYLERCRRILDDLDDADRALRGHNFKPHGDFRVTASFAFGRKHVLPILIGLLRKYPMLNVELSLDDRIVRLVEEGLDVAVRIAVLTDSPLHAVRIGTVRRVLVASPAYLKAHGEPTEISHLHKHKPIMFDSSTPNMEWRFAAQGRFAIRGQTRLTTNDAEFAVDAAINGIGIARVFSYQVIEHLKKKRLKYVLKNQEPPEVPVNLVFQGIRRRSPNLSAFIVATQEYFRDRNLS
ncbi:MAG: LysR family transcriptional regulator [Alphaproteobacteria bacterium]|nr:LysR family transcriptional regulator [Alphaproteobacteria bacterium]